MLQLTKFLTTSYSIHFTIQRDHLLGLFLRLCHRFLISNVFEFVNALHTLLSSSCVSGGPGQCLLMNCALEQNHKGGAEGPRMMWCFDGHSLPGGKLISLLAPAPTLTRVFMKSLLAPWYTTIGKAGEIYRNQSP